MHNTLFKCGDPILILLVANHALITIKFIITFFIAHFFFQNSFFGLHVDCLPFSIWIWIFAILTTECSLFFVLREITLHFGRTTLWFCGLSWLSGAGFACIFATQLNPPRLAIRRLTLAKPVTQRTITTFRLTHPSAITAISTVPITTVSIAIERFIDTDFFWFFSITRKSCSHPHPLRNGFTYFVSVAVIISCFTFTALRHSTEWIFFIIYQPSSATVSPSDIPGSGIQDVPL